MWALLGSALGLLGEGVKGFFGVQESKQKVLGTALEVMKDINSSAAAREQAIATVLAAEAGSDSWLTRMWRPMMMLIFSSLVVAYFFGYAPPNVLAPMPVGSALAELFELVKIGLMGYIPARTIDKAVDGFFRSQNLQRVIESLLKGKK